MTRHTVLAISLFLMFGLLRCGTLAGQAPPSLVITHVTVIDTHGGPSQPDMTVVIHGNRIAKIENGNYEHGNNATVLDGRGKFLIPGLWDMHVHLSWTTASALPLLVAKGVTHVRDMGGRLEELDAWRTKISAGLLVGPRIVRVGPILNGKSFNQFQMVPGNPEEARGVVHTLKFIGVDAIKVHRRLPRDSYFAAIDEAKRQGIPLVGHIPMSITPEEASDAGQATIEHTETLFEGTLSAGLKDDELPGAIEHFLSSGAADALFARFVKNHTVFTPTLAAYQSAVKALDPSAAPDPRSRYVARSLRNEFKNQHLSGDELNTMKRTFPQLVEVVRRMHRDGVMLLAGTDIAGPRIPGFALHEELSVLVMAGLTPLQTLQAATLNPALVLNKTGDFGSVESGKIADLVLLDADPLENIDNTRRISAVIVEGKLYTGRNLDKLMHEAERLASQN